MSFSKKLDLLIPDRSFANFTETMCFYNNNSSSAQCNPYQSQPCSRSARSMATQHSTPHTASLLTRCQPLLEANLAALPKALAPMAAKISDAGEMHEREQTTSVHSSIIGWYNNRKRKTKTTPSWKLGNVHHVSKLRQLVARIGKNRSVRGSL